MRRRARCVFIVPREEIDTKTQEYVACSWTGGVIFGMEGIEKALTVPLIEFDLTDFGFQECVASRVSMELIRMGQALQPGEGHNPATADRTLHENCSNCGMFDFKHVAVSVNGKTGPCTFSRRPITNASRLTMMRNSSDDARTMREAYAKAGLSELMHDGTFRAEMKAAKKVKTMAEPCNTWVAKTFGVDNAHDPKCGRFPCKAIHSKSEKYKAHATEYVQQAGGATWHAEEFCKPAATGSYADAAGSSSNQ